MIAIRMYFYEQMKKKCTIENQLFKNESKNNQIRINLFMEKKTKESKPAEMTSKRKIDVEICQCHMCDV